MSKICVIGLDGGTFTVIDYLIGEGRLPNFAALRQQGAAGGLMSTIPPLTPAAWSSFYTGTNPGRTGAVGFFKFRAGTYQLEPMNAGNVKGMPFWSLASRQGARVCVYNVPVTYPAAPVNGILISGMDAPRLDDRAVYPQQFRERLLAAVPDFRISTEIDGRYLVRHSRDHVAEAIRQLDGFLDMEIRTIRHLMQEEDWDLFVGVLRSTDVFQHYFWKAAEKVMSGFDADDNERRMAESVFSCYERIDRELGGSWLDWCADRDLVIMSDHGFGELRGFVALNRALADAGLLKFHSGAARRSLGQSLSRRVSSHVPVRARKGIKRLIGKGGDEGMWLEFVDSLVADIDWSQTRISSIAQFGCLYANLKGRDPLGTVSPAELDSVLAETEVALSQLRDPDDGSPMVDRFYRKEELYNGPVMREMPEMVVVLRDWAYQGLTSTAAELAEEAIIRPSRDEWKHLGHSGAHRQKGMLMLHGPDIASCDLGTVEMVDVAPTIMNLLGMPALDTWEGRVLREAISGQGAQKSAAIEHDSESAAPDTEVYSEADEEEIRKRLENLGYL